MRCAKFKKRIERYIDGEMESTEKAHFEAHLRGCTPCADVLRQAQEEVLLYKKVLSGFRLKGSLRERVVSRLHFIPAPDKKRAAGELKRWEIFAMSATAAALFIFAFCASIWLTCAPEEPVTQTPETVNSAATGSACIYETALVRVYWKERISPHLYYRAEPAQGESSGG